MNPQDDANDAAWTRMEAALRGLEGLEPPDDLLDRCLSGLEPDACDPASLHPGPETRDPRPTILVVDDEPNIRRLIRLHLEGAGWRVEEAVDGVAALARVPELRPDLVVLDVIMPGPSGFEVVTLLKSDPRTARILVVMLTAKDEYDDIRRGWNRGADCYFSKPFNPWELCATIGRMLAVRGTPEEPAPFRPWLK